MAIIQFTLKIRVPHELIINYKSIAESPNR